MTASVTRRRRALIAAVVVLAVALGGEIAELSPLVHLLCVAGAVAALAVIALVVPGLAAGDPRPGAGPGSGV